MSQRFVLVLVMTLTACVQGMYNWKTKTVSEEENHLVFPGTKWCGKGNNAMSFDDLGVHNQTDLCCRKHDHCPTYIPPFKRRYGLLNFHPMQMSHCSCEGELFDCLWNLHNPIATAVGRLYFNVFRNPCFELLEKRECVKWSFDWWNLNYYCIQYGLAIKAKTLWLKNYLRRFPDNVDRQFNSFTTTTATTTTASAPTSLQHAIVTLKRTDAGNSPKGTKIPNATSTNVPTESIKTTASKATSPLPTNVVKQRRNSGIVTGSNT